MQKYESPKSPKLFDLSLKKMYNSLKAKESSFIISSSKNSTFLHQKKRSNILDSLLFNFLSLSKKKYERKGNEFNYLNYFKELNEHFDIKVNFDNPQYLLHDLAKIFFAQCFDEVEEVNEENFTDLIKNRNAMVYAWKGLLFEEVNKKN